MRKVRYYVTPEEISKWSVGDRYKDGTIVALDRVYLPTGIDIPVLGHCDPKMPSIIVECQDD